MTENVSKFEENYKFRDLRNSQNPRQKHKENYTKAHHKLLKTNNKEKTFQRIKAC